jgi:para-nitrobenzyl esterase
MCRIAINTLVTLLGLVSSVEAGGASTSSAPIITTAQGTVAGSSEGAVDVFRGIPFAAPPVGAFRWRAPQPPATWSGVRATQVFGPSCPQVLSSPTQLAPIVRTGEDCLYLNVWAPRPRRGALPVMVWIHGGGFIAGSGYEAEYDGTALARRGVLVVTLNYRLGRLGFFAHPAIDREHPQEPHGNYALLDQLAALRWVRDNIANFGGDPKNVTVFGESAGGISIVALLNAPKAARLFAKAIVQSGAIQRPTRSMTADGSELPSAQTLGSRWAQSIGIRGAGPEVAAALRAVPTERVAPPAPPLAEILEILQASGPMIDGQLLSESPNIAFEGRVRNRVPLILGSNARECFVWSFEDSQLKVIPIVSMEPAAALRGIAANAREALLTEYHRGASASDVDSSAALVSDAFMGAPTFALATTLTSTMPVYLYRFTAVPGPAREVIEHAPHGTELFFVFGTLDRFRYRPDLIAPDDRRLSDVMADYWTSFARTGIPQAAGAATWAVLDAERPALLLLSNQGATTTAVPHLDALKLLEKTDGPR